MWAEGLLVYLYSDSEKNAILTIFLLLLHSLLLSPRRRLTLYAVTCDNAVFAVITVMAICLPLSKLCDKSQMKSNIWRGRSRRGEENCVCVCVCVKMEGVSAGCWREGESLLLKDRPGN